MRMKRLPSGSLLIGLAIASALNLPGALGAELPPDPSLDQAKLLGERGEIDAALQLCEESIQQGSDELAITMALAIARHGSKELNALQQQRIQGWIDAALKQNPDDPAMSILAADLKDLQEEFKEVAKIYRTLLPNKALTDIQRATVLNNLAYLMALDEHNGDEALPLIEEAIQIAGPVSELLDTRGAVRLAQGYTRSAIRDFRRAISASSSPIKVFHLADAYLASDEEYRAEATFKLAIEMGLEPKDIPPLEHGSYEALRDRFQLGLEK